MFLFFASQTSKTPKKKDRICLATFRLSEELSVLRLWCLVYAPFRKLTPCSGFHGFPQRHSRIAGTCRTYFVLLCTAALWEVAGACLLGKPETAHAAQTALQGAYPSKPCKTEFLWKAVVVWRHILPFFFRRIILCEGKNRNTAGCRYIGKWRITGSYRYIKHRL